VQGLGGAILFATSLALLADAFPEWAERSKALAVYGATIGASFAVGPAVGGALTSYVGWRWVFYVNVPVGLLALAVGWRRLPNVPGHPVPVPDALGALLITGGVGALVLGSVKGGTWGWGDARTAGVLALAAGALALFAVHCARHRNPLIDRELFRLRPLIGASAVAFFFTAAFGAMLLSRVLWAQDVWHWSALQTGLAIAPGPIMVPLFSFLLAGRLIARFGPGPVIVVGCATFATGIVWWALAMGLHPDYVGQMLGGMLLTGIGVGLTLPTFMASGAAALPAHSFATGSAVISMLRQIGLAVGVAVLIALLGSPRSPAAVLDVYERASYVIAALAVLAGIIAWTLLGARRPAMPAGQ
jgi:MFS family permease